MWNKKECGLWKCGSRIGLFLAAFFVICFVWYYLRPVEQGLHMKLLKMSYSGFDGMNTKSFLLGLVQSYIWGYIGVGLWLLVGCCHKHSKCKNKYF